MNEFVLQIVTPDGLKFEGKAQKVIVRTTEGDVGILANHISYVAPLSIGVARVVTSEGERRGACAGGILSVTDGEVRIAASTFEWGDEVDVSRAEKAKEKAEKRLSEHTKSAYEYNLAEVKLKKALARIQAAK